MEILSALEHKRRYAVTALTLLFAMLAYGCGSADRKSITIPDEIVSSIMLSDENLIVRCHMIAADNSPLMRVTTLDDGPCLVIENKTGTLVKIVSVDQEQLDKEFRDSINTTNPLDVILERPTDPTDTKVHISPKKNGANTTVIHIPVPPDTSSQELDRMIRAGVIAGSLVAQGEPSESVISTYDDTQQKFERSFAEPIFTLQIAQEQQD